MRRLVSWSFAQINNKKNLTLEIRREESKGSKFQMSWPTDFDHTNEILHLQHILRLLAPGEGAGWIPLILNPISHGGGGGGPNGPADSRNAFFKKNSMDMVQFFSLTFQANVQRTFWHPFGVTKPLGDHAIGRQSPKTRFWPKYEMVARDLVWPRNFFVKKQKFLKFVSQ